MFLLIGNIFAGPTASAICSAGCACLATSCYAAAGFVFGKILKKLFFFNLSVLNLKNKHKKVLSQLELVKIFFLKT